MDDHRLVALSRAPAAIGARERVAGIEFQAPAPDEGRGAVLAVVAESSGCIVRGDDPAPEVSPDPDDDRGHDLAVHHFLPLETRGRNPRIWAWRHEHIEENGEGHDFVVTRGWFDRETGGMRLGDTTRLPLTVLHEAPRVYGVRNGDVLEIVVPGADFGDARVRDAQGRVRQFQCTQARASLPLDVAPGTGAEVSITTNLRDDSLPKNIPPAAAKGKRHRVRTGTHRFDVSVSATRTSGAAEPWISMSTTIVD
jgi:hypothetical protein